MNIVFIVNPKSGSGYKKDIPDLIRQHIDKTVFSNLEIVLTEYAGHATELAKQFADKDFDMVVAVGGDGTVNEIGRGLIHTETAMGIIPAGSGNGLARHLRIPMNTKDAILLLNKPRIIKMDYGKANENIFFCTCGTGFDAYISQLFAKSSKRGFLTYAEKAITEFFSYNLCKYIISNDEINLSGKAFVVTFANASQFGNNAYIAPEASIKDGLMDISFLSPFPLRAMPGIVIKLFNKTLNKSLYMKTLKTKKITVTREEEGPFHYDGEPTMEGKIINIEIIPQGLKVCTKTRN